MKTYYDWLDEARRKTRFKFALIGLGLIAMVLCGAVVLTIQGCASWSGHLGVDQPKPSCAEPHGIVLVPDTRPAPPADQDELGRWFDERCQTLARRFVVPPPTWEIRNDPPPWREFTVIGSHVSGTYAAGFYLREHGRIVVFAVSPSCEPVPAATMRATFLHEFMHHLEACAGVEANPDHQEEFDRWGVVLRLDK